MRGSRGSSLENSTGEGVHQWRVCANIGHRQICNRRKGCSWDIRTLMCHNDGIPTDALTSNHATASIFTSCSDIFEGQQCNNQPDCIWTDPFCIPDTSRRMVEGKDMKPGNDNDEDEDGETSSSGEDGSITFGLRGPEGSMGTSYYDFWPYIMNPETTAGIRSSHLRGKRNDFW